MRTRALLLHALVRLGELERAEQDIAGLGEQDRDQRGDTHRPGRAAARPGRPARGDRRARAGPVRLRTRRPGDLAGSAFLLEAIARDALGDPAAARDALERALDLAEPDGVLAAFLLHPPARELLDRHAPDRGDQAALAAEIRSLLPAEPPEGPPANQS